MSTANQTTANRENAQHSTGPRTEEGKSASSQNGFKHGLASGRLIIDGESQEEFDELYAALIDDNQPTDANQEILVREMSEARWLVQRSLRFQADLFERCDDPAECAKYLGVFIRYQTANQRQFHKAMDQLRKLQKQKEKDEIGFASETYENPADDPAFNDLRERYGDGILLDALVIETAQTNLDATAEFEHQQTAA